MRIHLLCTRYSMRVSRDYTVNRKNDIYMIKHEELCYLLALFADKYSRRNRFMRMLPKLHIMFRDI